MRKLLSAVFATALLAVTPVAAHAVPPSFSANGAMIFACTVNHAAAEDPILSWGVTPSAHAHAFSGSDQAGPSTTFPQMLGGGTSCNWKSDKSIYWTPAVVNDGTIYNPTANSIYYRAANRGGLVRPFPPGFRYVSGNPNNLSGSAARYRCSNEGLERTSIPTNCNGAGFVMSQYLTSCWDGKNYGPGGGGMGGPTNGRDHVSNVIAETDPNTPQVQVCPASHPILLPVLQPQWSFPAGAVGGRLTSDAVGATAGASAHQDVFIAFDIDSAGHDSFARFTDECLNVVSTQNISCRVNPNGDVVTYPGGVKVTD